VGHIALVLNDSSGRGVNGDIAERLKQVFAAAGKDVRLTVAGKGTDIRALMRQTVAEGCDTLVAGGGDGTISAGAAAVLERGIPLGVLPLGTLNHFAKDLGIPLDVEQAARVLLDGVVCRVDVGEINGRIFLNNSSLGVYPAIVRLRERYRTRVPGKWLAALWAALTVLRRNPFMAVRIVVEDQTVIRRTPFLLVANNEYRMAGLQAGARESLAQGQLAVYVLNAERRPGLLRLAWQLLLRGGDQVKELDLFTVREATVETRRTRLQVALDGEVTTLSSPLEYRLRPGGLRVHVPDQGSACYPHPPRPSSTRS
jgi:diacylglycerol kinase family enzyme